MGGVAPAANVVNSVAGVSVGIPDEISVMGGTLMPGTSVGLGIANVGENVLLVAVAAATGVGVAEACRAARYAACRLLLWFWL